MSQQTAIELLTLLAGTWKGKGHAEYPTIISADYAEELTFTRIGSDPVFHFEQKTWYISTDEKNNTPLHFECGYIFAKETGIVEMLNAQNSGRVEVLSGGFDETHKGEHHLFLESVLFGNDERMFKTTRDFYFTGAELSYEMSMATSKVPDLRFHLDANLRKT